MEDLAARTRLDDGSLSRLAESGALERFGKRRRDALWKVKGLQQDDGPLYPDALYADALQAGHVREPDPGLQPLDDFQTIRWDYDFTGHSPRGHPLAPLRDQLRAQHLPDAATLRTFPDGRRVRYAGLVICRQRPATAGGVVFMTLEDETGFVNLVLWEKVFEQYRLLAKTESFLGITGKLQVQSGVVHLVVEQLWTPQVNIRPRGSKSRDFH